MTDTAMPRAIPFYVIAAAIEHAKPEDEYAVVRSDNDYQYARTHDEAATLADEMRSQTDSVSPLNHTVQIVELQEVPPEA